MKTIEPSLLVDSHHGVYIPKLFCEIYLHYIVNVDEFKEEIEDCLLGPDSETYWDSWTSIEDSALILDDNKTECYLYSNGDLWAVPYDYNNEDFFNY